MREHHVRPEGLPPVNGYSHAVASQGRTVVVSGQLPLDGRGDLVGGADAERQAEQVFANLAVALAAAGARLDEVVKLTVYLTDRADLAGFRRARDRHLDAARPPASTLVFVPELLHPGCRVEIDAVAVR